MLVLQIESHSFKRKKKRKLLFHLISAQQNKVKTSLNSILHHLHFLYLFNAFESNRALNSSPFSASWEASFKDDGEAPQVNGAKSYSFEELKKCTNNFPEVNVIGIGGYGKVIVENLDRFH